MGDRQSNSNSHRKAQPTQLNTTCTSLVRAGPPRSLTWPFVNPVKATSRVLVITVPSRLPRATIQRSDWVAILELAPGFRTRQIIIDFWTVNHRPTAVFRHLISVARQIPACRYHHSRLGQGLSDHDTVSRSFQSALSIIVEIVSLVMQRLKREY
jgi:hypothetical protein